MMLLSHFLRVAGNRGVRLVGSASVWDASGSFSVDLSGLDIRAGDIGLLFTVRKYYANQLNAPNGYTLLQQIDQGSASFPEQSLFAKTMTGLETSVGSYFYYEHNVVAQFLLWRGATFPDTSGALAGRTCASLSASDRDVFITSYGWRNSSVPGAIAPPDGYATTPLGVVGYTGAFGSWQSCAYKSVSAGLESPGVWGYSGGTENNISVLLSPA